MFVEDNTNDTSNLGTIIEDLTRKTLELRRQINEIRKIREIEKCRSDRVKRHYKRRMNIRKNRLQWILYRKNLQHYINVAKLQYDDDIELPFVIQKHAAVLHMTRSSNLFEIYTRILYRQNQQYILQVERFINHERKQLMDRQTKLIVAKNVALYCKVQLTKRKKQQYYHENDNNIDNTISSSQQKLSLLLLRNISAFDTIISPKKNNISQEEEKYDRTDNNIWI
mmetsp:Transcript_14443/g.16573  ORF Transcript_14443/g.16573 Transcript_14443/m.16573 type:complete len:225 (-) Transcript_14443:286-960(-)